MKYAVYDPSTGIIRYISESSEDSTGGVDFTPPASDSYITYDDEISPDTYYVDLSTLELAPKTPIDVPSTQTVQVNSVLSMSGLPDCSVAFYKGAELTEVTEGGVTFIEVYGDDIASAEISDGVLNFTSDLAGEYTLILTAPLYLETSTVITVTE